MLKRFLKIRYGMVWFKSGSIYNFSYKRFQHDPEPTIIVIDAIRGTHPKTGHYHNYIQAINFNYIPRDKRKEFVREWIYRLELNKGNIPLTWEVVKAKYPYMILAFRRYLLDNGVIKYNKEIPIEDIENVVISTWIKDYSKQAMIALITKYKKTTKMFNTVYDKNIWGKNIFNGKKEFGGKIK